MLIAAVPADFFRKFIKILNTEQRCVKQKCTEDLGGMEEIESSWF